MYKSEIGHEILGLERPWHVADESVNHEQVRLDLIIRYDSRTAPCRHCGQECKIHDTRQRHLRDGEASGYPVWQHVHVPRVKCPDCGKIGMIRYPLADDRARCTLGMEDRVIRALLSNSIAGAARDLGLTEKVVRHIMMKAVERGLSRRIKQFPRHICVDEVCFSKGKRYVTVVSCRETGVVLFVTEGRDSAALKRFYDALNARQKAAIGTISMDMSPAYLKATREAFGDAAEKMICIDRFHVQQLIGKAVDQVRKGENRDLMIKGDRTLVSKKHLVLMKPQNMNREMRRLLDEVVKQAKRTGRAWAILEMSRGLWGYVSRTWARKMWLKLIGWMQRSRLEPMRRAARTLKKHLDGILNAIVHKATNAMAESNNAKIKAIKVRAKGFGSMEGFQNAILFHMGGLRLETGYQHPHQQPVSA